MADEPDKEDALVNMWAAIHDLSMSDEPAMSVAGRFFKQFFEPFDEFEREEVSRGTHRGIIIAGMTHAMTVMLAISAYPVIKSGKEDKAKRELIRLFELVLGEVFDAQKGTRVERSKRRQSSALDSH